ncbi:MAG: class I SAM-dependent methyltransferase [Actinomycetia bacterium]|nr:class I SAM-dependent methyltransferase [Actinomycetes bacterium]
MSNSGEQRQAHIVTDLESRAVKAEKIIRLLDTRVSLQGSHVLEVGCGTGVLSSRLGAEVGSEGSACAVDKVDERQVTDGYRFSQVAGTTLPYGDAAFDIVISNHVIEHVGEAQDQLRHLTELERVLAPAGLVYLAGPHRWQLVEPHYRLPFLGWFPQRVADTYLRLTGRGSWYDVCPPSRRSTRSMAAEVGLDIEEVTGEVAWLMVGLEGGRGIRRVAFWVAARMIRLLPGLSSTQVLLLRSRPG